MEQNSFQIDSRYSINTDHESLLPIAKEMSKELEHVLKTRIPVLYKQETSPCIIIGFHEDKKNNGPVIKVIGRNVSIIGSNLADTVRGVYVFLNRYAGLKYYTSKCVTVTKDRIEVPQNTDEQIKRYFEYADTDWLSPKDIQYSLYNGINALEYRSIPKELGGGIAYLPCLCHTLGTKFCSRDTYFKTHPEYFALRNGKRVPGQLCLTNPNVKDLVTGEVLELLKEKHDPESELQIITLTQDDNEDFCRCPECTRIDQKYKSHAGTMLDFVNGIARTIKVKGYKNVALDTFAYRYTRKPPIDIWPEDNVIIRLCTIECCFSHSFDDSSCKVNREFMKDLKGWSEICNRIYVWDYCTNFSFLTGIFPNFGVLQRDIQMLYENHVKGIYEEGNFSLDVCDTEFGELRAYLLTKLFQNPYCDYEKEMLDFLTVYYGGGAAYIGEFLKLTQGFAARRHLGIFQSMHMTMKMNKEEVRYCDSLWEKAMDAAEGEYSEHVRLSRLCWRYWKRKNHVMEFAPLLTRRARRIELMNEIKATGIKRIHEVDIRRTIKATMYQDSYTTIFPIVNALLKFKYRL